MGNAQRRSWSAPEARPLRCPQVPDSPGSPSLARCGTQRAAEVWVRRPGPLAEWGVARSSPRPIPGQHEATPPRQGSGCPRGTSDTTPGPLVLRHSLNFPPPYGCPPLSMEFSRQEYGNGLPFHSPGRFNPPTPKYIYLFLSANAIVAAFLNSPGQFIFLGLHLLHGRTLIS